ncbi:nucleotidyltransferase family protein [Amphibacillus sp. Q70]|uniref:nucleotidyltransferase family protein n=1 Tax=Amphibacillus sp. Q70 TaxID=3453416 RepID=UPI003F85624E
MELETKLINILKEDSYIIKILQAVEKLHLKDGWVAAGLIRNKVWDVLYDTDTPPNDIDVIYFDSKDISRATEKIIEAQLEKLMPEQPWSVKNQARMHQKNNNPPYRSSFDGVAHFPEIPTAVAARIHQHEVEIMAPYGLEDLFQGIVKPTHYYQEGTELSAIYKERMQKKKWQTIWSDLVIE